MKNYFALILVVVVTTISSCKFAQVIYTGALSNNVQESPKCFFFENDTAKVTYVFWGYKGKMAFGVFNKLDVPIYIDWKKSSFINKQMKYDYYSDREQRTSARISTSFVNPYPIDWGVLFGPVAVSAALGSEVSEREERITFIPPKSYITRSSYNILSDGSYFTLAGATEKTVPLPEDTTKSFKARVVSIDKSNPSFVFRNFLTLSTKESFEEEYYINNEFYIRKVMTIKQSVFENYNFGSEKRFYIDQISDLNP